jgi:hypothetical protein
MKLAECCALRSFLRAWLGVLPNVSHWTLNYSNQTNGSCFEPGHKFKFSRFAASSSTRTTMSQKRQGNSRFARKTPSHDGLLAPIGLVSGNYFLTSTKLSRFDRIIDESLTSFASLLSGIELDDDLMYSYIPIRSP